MVIKSLLHTIPASECLYPLKLPFSSKNGFLPSRIIVGAVFKNQSVSQVLSIQSSYLTNIYLLHDYGCARIL